MSGSNHRVDQQHRNQVNDILKMPCTEIKGKATPKGTLPVHFLASLQEEGPGLSLMQAIPVPADRRSYVATKRHETCPLT